MKTIKKISEDEMISEFLKAEINSPRFGKEVRGFLKRDGKNKKILLKPDIKDKNENIYRKKLLGRFRGFNKNESFFENFPTNVFWEKVIVNKKELKKIKYVNYSYWNELSNKTRLPVKAAENIKKNLKPYGVSNKGFFEILHEIKKCKRFQPIILVAKNKKSRKVILEGHARMTAYFLNKKYLPQEMEVIIGYSNKIDKWGLY